MDIKDKIELYKEMYHNELARRDNISSEVFIPLAMIGFLIGAFSYCFDKADSISHLIPFSIVLLSLLILFFCIILTVYFTIKANYNHQYAYMPTAKVLNDYYDEWQEFYRKTKTIGIEKKTDEKFNQYLLKKYCECNNHNALKNDKRSNALHFVRKYFIIGIIAAGIAICFCNYDKWFSINKNYDQLLTKTNTVPQSKYQPSLFPKNTSP